MAALRHRVKTATRRNVEQEKILANIHVITKKIQVSECVTNSDVTN